MKIFVDNDVILDVLLKRDEFKYSKKVLEDIEKKLVNGITSPIIFTNTFYIISKLSNYTKAWFAIKELRLLLNISKINKKIVDKALNSDFTDFEDAIQFYSALEENVDYIVTRNKKNYGPAKAIIINPLEYIALRKHN